MIAACANPVCNSPFLYWRGGKLFRFERVSGSRGDNLPRRVEHYWLCAACARHLTMRCRPGGVPEIVSQGPTEQLTWREPNTVSAA